MYNQETKSVSSKLTERIIKNKDAFVHRGCLNYHRICLRVAHNDSLFQSYFSLHFKCKLTSEVRGLSDNKMGLHQFFACHTDTPRLSWALWCRELQRPPVSLVSAFPGKQNHCDIFSVDGNQGSHRPLNGFLFSGGKVVMSLKWFSQSEQVGALTVSTLPNTQFLPAAHKHNPASLSSRTDDNSILLSLISMVTK